MKILFIGENRSPSAIRMNVTWKDKRLAAKQLFDAFDMNNINYSEFEFCNVKEPKDFLNKVESALADDVPIIGLGKVVQQILNNMDIKHTPMIHPAARGLIRKKEHYAEHVRNTIEGVAVEENE